ncbi:MAG: SDR family oxidoreductase [Gemmatimonadales bacterium]
MIVALTGATGFVGGAVLRRLLRREHQVRVLVRNPDPPRDHRRSRGCTSKGPPHSSRRLGRPASAASRT